MIRRGVALAAAWLALAAWPVLAQSVTVKGLDGQTARLAAADLAALPRQSVSLTHDGRTVVYSGAPLAAILRRVGAPAGPALHGPELADIVVVTARDGYRVALALADTDPLVRPGRIILADQADGAPLPPTEGPFRLIVEGDLRAARAARMVSDIAVERAP
jgi:hypothetical protein